MKTSNSVIDKNGNKQWFLNGKHHREDGPAIENIDGSKYWYYNGKHLNCKSKEEFEKLMKLKFLL